MPSADSDPREEGTAASARRRREGLLALVLVQLFFGLFPLFIKLATEGFSPRALAVWRIAVGAAVLGGLALARHGRALVPPRGDLARIALCSMLGIVVNQVTAMEGMTRTSVVAAGLLMTLIPVFTYTVAMLARQERFAGRRALGILTALAGVAALTVLGAGDGENSVLGNLLIACNCLSYACFLILARDLLARHSSAVVIAWVFLFALPTLPLIAIGQPLVPAEASVGAWRALVYTLVFPTILAYLLNTFALARVSASTTAVFIYMQPLVAGASGVIVLGESLHASTLASAALILLGIGLVVVRPRARPGQGG
jgi:drug/metabolite transporter (DMT)-like permease